MWGTGEAPPTAATRLASTLGFPSVWKAGLYFAWLLAVFFSFFALCQTVPSVLQGSCGSILRPEGD